MNALLCCECGESCTANRPCHCCLAAEVEALRAQVQADEEAERSLRARYNDLLVDHARLAAQVLRVRAVADAWEYYASENGNVRTAWAASSVREALDGDGDA